MASVNFTSKKTAFYPGLPTFVREASTLIKFKAFSLASCTENFEISLIFNSFLKTGETFPNHYAIATGMHAESHGIVANSFYDPALNQTFKRTMLDPIWWQQAEPIWITARKQGKITATSFWAGSSVTFPGNWTANYYYTRTSTEYN